jgi:hypothetical protein
MANNREIQNVAVVGTGVIGASWAAYYLSRGFNVCSLWDFFLETRKPWTQRRGPWTIRSPRFSHRKQRR